MKTSTTARSLQDASGGIRTELVVDDPDCCPVADASNRTGRSAFSVRRTSQDDGRVVGEFELGTDHDAPGQSPTLDAGECERVFSTDTGDVYQFDAEPSDPCPCETVESLGVPLAAVTARRGRLHLTFHASDPSTVREVVEALRERHDDVCVRQMRRSTGDHSERPVLVDRNRLTDRQLEVVETAWQLDYFEDPRGATGTEVAAALDISRSTFAEHLAAAQRKVLGDVLER
jgi:hypothetical protein